MSIGNFEFLKFVISELDPMDLYFSSLKVVKVLLSRFFGVLPDHITEVKGGRQVVGIGITAGQRLQAVAVFDKLQN